tara:strand:+ start:54 stop:560 length:507 start_codon:yes stop_codon:yes gene_type:complete
VKLNEIKTLDQLIVELMKNNYRKMACDPFDEDCEPVPGSFSVHFLGKQIDGPKVIEPRTEICICPKQPCVSMETIASGCFKSIAAKFFISAYCYPTLESIQNPCVEFEWPKWKWGEGTSIKEGYPSGKILEWQLLDNFTNAACEIDGSEFNVDNLTLDFIKFMKTLLE